MYTPNNKEKSISFVLLRKDPLRKYYYTVCSSFKNDFQKLYGTVEEFSNDPWLYKWLKNNTKKEIGLDDFTVLTKKDNFIFIGCVSDYYLEDENPFKISIHRLKIAINKWNTAMITRPDELLIKYENKNFNIFYRNFSESEKAIISHEIKKNDNASDLFWYHNKKNEIEKSKTSIIKIADSWVYQVYKQNGELNTIHQLKTPLIMLDIYRKAKTYFPDHWKKRYLLKKTAKAWFYCKDHNIKPQKYRNFYILSGYTPEGLNIMIIFDNNKKILHIIPKL